MRSLLEFGGSCRVLVTGGAGFVGAALCEELVGRGCEVVALDDHSGGGLGRLVEREGLQVRSLDVSSGVDVGRVLLEEGPFEVVFHLAARVGVRAVLEDPEGARRVNEAGVLGVLEGLRSLGGQRPRLFCASSSEVYADAVIPLEEEAALRSVDGVGRWAYAGSKLRGEAACDEARGLWGRGLGPVHLRFFNVVGPGQDGRAGFVLPRFVEAAQRGRALRVHGDGSAVRTFAHVGEVARVLAGMALHPAVPEGPLNVGGVARASVLELARAVAAGASAASLEEPEIVWVDPREELGEGFEEVSVRLPALGRLAALGCGVPSMALEEIVADTLARHAVPGEVSGDCSGEVAGDDGGAACASRAS